MKDFFLRDSVLKIISFVIALLLWIYIIAVVDPSVDVTVKDIPIRYTNQNMIEDKNLCLINDSKATVELKIRGSRKRIANIDNKNIYATVDLATVGKTGTFSLPIAISIPYEYSEIISKKPYNASVVIDKVITAEKEVKVITSGSTANGYVAGEAVVDVQSVRLRGAASMIERIDHVAAELNYDDRSADINDTEKLFFVDKDSKRISDSNEVYNHVSMSLETVQVSCPVFKVKNVPIRVSAQASGGINSYKISVQPSMVSIYGENEALEEVDEIFTEVVYLDNLEDETTTCHLVLPEGIKLRDGISEVTVNAEKRD